MPAFLLSLTGDVLPVRPLADAAPASRQAAEAVFEQLHMSDVSIGNFEMPLTDRGVPLEKLLNIRAHPTLAADLPAMGFDVLNLANNHTVDYGWPGLADTVQAVRAVGIETLGVGENLDAALRPVTLDAQGRRVGVIACSCLLPTGMTATDLRPGLAPLHVETSYEVDPYYQMEEPGDPACVRIRTRVRAADLQRVVEEIQRLRKQVDVLVVTIHWGFGSGEELAEYQQPLAHALIDAGADVIHGHHPHAVHAVGFHHGRPIFYSLGTFIGQQIFLPAPDAVQSLWGGMSPDGYLARVEFGDMGIHQIRLTPTTLDAERLPVVATGADFERIAQRLVRLSTPHGALVTVRDGQVWVRPDTPPGTATRQSTPEPACLAA